MTNTGAALRLVDLSKTYGRAEVVDHINLDVAPGEFVTLLGPSGSGKTTTLNMIAGFTDVTSGEILMDGRPIAGVRPHKRGIGVVFQHYALFPHMTAAGNVAFPLKQRRVPKPEATARVDEALELVGLTGLGDRFPRQLSGGQQQRVALARALVFQPRVLLMDEPLGALDEKLRESLQLEIRRIHREVGISFVYVTHDQEEALALSDRIAVFNNGRIEQVGTAEDLYERPATVFVADFLGESNRVAGRYLTDGLAGCLRHGDVRLPAPARALGGVEQDAVLVIRPEHISLTTCAEATARSATLAGRVTEVLYLGGTRRVEVRLSDEVVFVVREQAGRWKPLALGDRVALDYPPTCAVLLPAGAASGPSEAAEWETAPSVKSVEVSR